MEKRIEVGGHGGQGVVLMSYLLADLGMRRGLNVTWFPSYGAEMRGGAASCSVIFSTDPIASPVIAEATHIMSLNNPALKKLLPQLVQGGIVLYNSSLVTDPPEDSRDDIEIIPIPVSDMAEQLGQGRVANMVMLGAFIARTSLASEQEVKQAMEMTIPAKHANLIPLNMKAIYAGMKFME